MLNTGDTPSPAQPDAKFNLEFRDHSDDAWYTVRVINEGETLRVKFDCFPISHDQIFFVEGEKENLNLIHSNNWKKLSSVDELEDLEERFRPISTQLQDKDCHKVVQGIVACVSFIGGDSDLRFYDAVVDDVLRKEHSFADGEEVCKSRFLLYWKHGPSAGNLAEKKVEHICLVQDTAECDLALYSFLKLAREKLVGAPSVPSPTETKLFSCSDDKLQVAGSPTIMQKLASEPRMMERFKFARRSVASKGIRSETIRQDRDFGGYNLCYTVFVDNLEKDLSSSTIMEFIKKQTGVTSEVYIFPIMSSEIYARCSITLDCAKNFDIVSGFLENPNHFVTSLKGKPWVVLEKKTERKIFRTPLRTLMLSNQIDNVSENVDKLKIVHSGSKDQYENAKTLRDFFLHNVGRQHLFQRRLLSMEEKHCL